jgi:hypothetical protein
MKKMLVLAGLSGILLQAGCFPDDFVLFPDRPSARETAYLEKVKDQFLEFEVQVSEDAAAWDRARFVLTTYGKAMAGQNRLMTSTDSVLEIPPRKNDQHYGEACADQSGYAYRVTREPAGEMVRYKISFCYPSASPPSTDYRELCARAIAYYIVSGEFMKRAIY